MPSGGWHPPAKPAPVSGPGSLSRRTDGGQPLRAPTGMPYGDHQALMDQERSAPMSQTQAAPTPSPSAIAEQAGQGVSPALVPLGAASARPGEPVTAGVDIGHGPGPEALSVPPQGLPGAPMQGPMTRMLQQIAATDTSGQLGTLLQAAMTRGV